MDDDDLDEVHDLAPVDDFGNEAHWSLWKQGWHCAPFGYEPRFTFTFAQEV